MNHCTSACRSCSFYKPEGRRGGMCQQLGVLVQARWKSCSLASPAFMADYHGKEEIAILEKTFSLGCATPQSHSSDQLTKKMGNCCPIEAVNMKDYNLPV